MGQKTEKHKENGSESEEMLVQRFPAQWTGLAAIFEKF
jgi:hypothetical protein